MIYTDDGVLVSLAEHGLCVLASSLPKFETAKDDPLPAGMLHQLQQCYVRIPGGGGFQPLPRASPRTPPLLHTYTTTPEGGCLPLSVSLEIVQVPSRFAQPVMLRRGWDPPFQVRMSWQASEALSLPVTLTAYALDETDLSRMHLWSPTSPPKHPLSGENVPPLTVTLSPSAGPKGGFGGEARLTLPKLCFAESSKMRPRWLAFAAPLYCRDECLVCLLKLPTVVMSRAVNQGEKAMRLLWGASKPAAAVPPDFEAFCAFVQERMAHMQLLRPLTHADLAALAARAGYVLPRETGSSGQFGASSLNNSGGGSASAGMPAQQALSGGGSLSNVSASMGLPPASYASYGYAPSTPPPDAGNLAGSGGGGGSSPALAARGPTPSELETFKQWLDDQLSLAHHARRLFESSDPQVVAGFAVGRDRAEALLALAPPGTALIRFSSQPAHMVLSVREDAPGSSRRVQHVEVRRELLQSMGLEGVVRSYRAITHLLDCVTGQAHALDTVLQWNYASLRVGAGSKRVCDDRGAGALPLGGAATPAAAASNAASAVASPSRGDWHWAGTPAASPRQSTAPAGAGAGTWDWARGRAAAAYGAAAPAPAAGLPPHAGAHLAGAWAPGHAAPGQAAQQGAYAFVPGAAHPGHAGAYEAGGAPAARGGLPPPGVPVPASSATLGSVGASVCPGGARAGAARGGEHPAEASPSSSSQVFPAESTGATLGLGAAALGLGAAQHAQHARDAARRQHSVPVRAMPAPMPPRGEGLVGMEPSPPTVQGAPPAATPPPSERASMESTSAWGAAAQVAAWAASLGQTSPAWMGAADPAAMQGGGGGTPPGVPPGPAGPVRSRSGRSGGSPMAAAGLGGAGMGAYVGVREQGGFDPERAGYNPVLEGLGAEGSSGPFWNPRGPRGGPEGVADAWTTAEQKEFAGSLQALMDAPDLSGGLSLAGLEVEFEGGGGPGEGQ